MLTSFRSFVRLHHHHQHQFQANTTRSQARSSHHQLERWSLSISHRVQRSHNKSSSIVGCHMNNHNNESSTSQRNHHVWSQTQRTWPSFGRSQTLMSLKFSSTWVSTTPIRPSTLLDMVLRWSKPINCPTSPLDMVLELASLWLPPTVNKFNRSFTVTLNTWDWSNNRPLDWWSVLIWWWW